MWDYFERRNSEKEALNSCLAGDEGAVVKVTDDAKKLHGKFESQIKWRQTVGCGDVSEHSVKGLDHFYPS